MTMADLFEPVSKASVYFVDIQYQWSGGLTTHRKWDVFDDPRQMSTLEIGRRKHNYIWIRL